MQTGFKLLALTFILCLSTTCFSQENITFWKMKIGDFDFYTIQDSTGEFDNKVFANADKTILEKVAPTGKTRNSCNVFVLTNGSKTILFDAGMGRNLFENLKKAGIDPKEVNAVFITHTHGDHVGGLLNGDKPNFPNAEIWMSAEEIQFWKSSNPNLFEKCQNAYGKIQTVVPDEKTPLIIPEITAIDIAGHTPGHVAYLISSNGERLLIAGDILHSAEIQFAYPDICATFDRDVPKSVVIRREILNRTAKEGWKFAAVHLPDDGIGTIAVERTGFRFSPIQ